MTFSYQRGGRMLLAVIAAFAILGIASAVAAASPTNIPSWRSGGATIPWGTSDSVGGESIAGLNLQYKGSNGVPISVACETLSASGKVENPAAGKAGTLANGTGTAGPSGTFQGCELVRYGEKSIVEGLQCTIPKTIAMESTIGNLTNEASPSGGLKLATSFKFVVTCPAGSVATWRFTLSGIGKEQWEGQQYYAPGSTKIEGSYGTVNGSTVTGEASYGISVMDAKGPVTVGQLAYEEPQSTSGNLWYRGGAFRNLSEGLRTLVTPGAPATLSGGAALTLEFASSGTSMVVTCNSGGVSGTVENPSGGGPGVATVTLNLTGCSVSNPAGLGCTVSGGSITMKSMPGMVKSASEGYPIFKLGTEGNEVAAFTVSGCSIGALNHIYRVKGPLFVKAQMKAAKQTGSWSVPAVLNGPTTGLLTTNGQVTTASGEITAEIGGEVVTMG